MPYKISFYGDRKEEIIPDEGGKVLYTDFSSGELPDRVEIRSGLTVERRQIKDVEFIAAQREHVDHSRSELEHFEESKLRPFLDEKGRLTLHKELMFLQSERLIRVTKNKGVDVIKTVSDCILSVRSALVEEYAKMDEKLSQWKMLVGRKHYGKRMRDQELEETANTS